MAPSLAGVGRRKGARASKPDHTDLSPWIHLDIAATSWRNRLALASARIRSGPVEFGERIPSRPRGRRLRRRDGGGDSSSIGSNRLMLRFLCQRHRRRPAAQICRICRVRLAIGEGARSHVTPLVWQRRSWSPAKGDSARLGHRHSPNRWGRAGGPCNLQVAQVTTQQRQPRVQSGTGAIKMWPPRPTIRDSFWADCDGFWPHLHTKIK